jgi:hypothetical protein
MRRAVIHMALGWSLLVAVTAGALVAPERDHPPEVTVRQDKPLRLHR